MSTLKTLKNRPKPKGQIWTRGLWSVSHCTFHCVVNFKFASWGTYTALAFFTRTLPFGFGLCGQLHMDEERYLDTWMKFLNGSCEIQFEIPVKLSTIHFPGNCEPTQFGSIHREREWFDSEKELPRVQGEITEDNWHWKSCRSWAGTSISSCMRVSITEENGQNSWISNAFLFCPQTRTMHAHFRNCQSLYIANMDLFICKCINSGGRSTRTLLMCKKSTRRFRNLEMMWERKFGGITVPLAPLQPVAWQSLFARTSNGKHLCLNLQVCKRRSLENFCFFFTMQCSQL